MTVRSRLALASPLWRYAIRKSREAARLTATVRRLTEALAVVTADRDALRSHYDLARSQRDGARDLLVAITSEPAWSQSDRAFLDDAGVEPA